MKVILDLDELLKTQKITPEQAEYFKQLSVKEAGSTGINILLVLGVLSVSLGVFALNPSDAFGIFNGVSLIAIGFLFRSFDGEKWKLLNDALNLLGSFIFAYFFHHLFYWKEGWLLISMFFLLFGFFIQNRVLIAMSPFVLLMFGLDSTTEENINRSIVLFSCLALGSFWLGKQFERWAAYFNVYSRACVVAVNLVFWIGSVTLAFDRITFSDVKLLTYGAIWALCLFVLGAWAIKTGRRAILNIAAVFLTIDLLTQWFLTLGVRPASLLLGGCMLIGITMALAKYNKDILNRI